MKELETVLEQRFGLVFSDKQLLETAFTHTSYANEHRLLKISHNERLEFFRRRCSAIIDFRISVQKISKKTRGDLSKLRAMIVREESLAGFARDCQFDQFIKLGKGEEKSGGRNRDTILGDAFEAFLGALLLDKDLLTVKEFIYQVMIPKVEAGDFEMIKDYKTHLQELLQVNGDVDIRYQVISEIGPAHDKMFEVEVLVEGQSLGRGQGRSKKLAEQEAAKNAVEEGLDSCI